jgi:hypothetical protein
MHIAKQKRKENIVEYILYLFQIEDLIRAFQLDMNLIESQLIAKYQVDDSLRTEIISWYQNLVLMMEKEGIQQKGHFQFLQNLIQDLNEFHLRLLDTETDENYITKFQSVAGLATELKTKNTTATNDIQRSLDAIYGFLLLKMQKREITNETTEAVKRLSIWLNLLSKLYKDFEENKLDLE